MCSKFTGEHPCQSAIKAAKQLYWNYTSAWVLSCIFAAYLQDTFSWEHLWRAAYVFFFYRNFADLVRSPTDVVLFNADGNTVATFR